MVRRDCFSFSQTKLSYVTPSYEQQSYRLVPTNAAASSTSAGSSTSHPQFAGVHDALRSGGPRSFSAEVSAPQHPLEHRLAQVRPRSCLERAPYTKADAARNGSQWDDTRDNLKFNVQRTAFGMHMPIRQAMERQLVGFVGVLFRDPINLRPDLVAGSHFPRAEQQEQHSSRHPQRQRRELRRERCAGGGPR